MGEIFIQRNARKYHHKQYLNRKQPWWIKEKQKNKKHFKENFNIKVMFEKVGKV